MVVRVSEVTPGEHNELLQTLQRAAKERSAMFFVVCVDPHETPPADALAAIVDEATRRMNGQRSGREHLCVGDLRMDRNRYEVTRAGRPIALSPMEYSLLEFLMLHHDRAQTEQVLMNSVFHGVSKNGRFNTLWVHIHRLRKKVDRDDRVPLIHTIKGVGYILKSPQPASAAQG